MPLSGQGGRTPLHLVASWGLEKVVRVLLDAGADQDAQDQVPGAALQRESRGVDRVRGAGCISFVVEGFEHVLRLVFCLVRD